jgi:four helix bundle protein
MQRAAISIPSNIAEGYKRQGTKEYLYFLGIAEGSAAELETQIFIAKELYKNLETENSEKLIVEIQKILYAIRKKLS